MAPKVLPSPEVLRQLLRYEPETGKLFWLHRPSGMFQSAGRARAWNVRYAGMPAFTAKDAHGYFVGNLKGVCAKAHRVIWALVSESWPTADVDHINGDRSDNRLINLRAATRGENLGNTRQTVRQHHWRGIKPADGRWVARISSGNKQVHIGMFGCPTAAAIAYDKAARQLRGDFAATNFSWPE